MKCGKCGSWVVVAEGGDIYQYGEIPERVKQAQKEGRECSKCGTNLNRSYAPLQTIPADAEAVEARPLMTY